MKFETEIKTALKAAGLNEGLWKRIHVNSVDEISGAVQQLKTDMEKLKTLSGDELIEALKEAGLDEAVSRHLKSESDRRVNEAIRTHDEKLKNKTPENGGKPGEDDKNKSPEMTGLLEKIKTLEEMVTTLSKTNQTSQIQTKVREALKAAGLSEDFVEDIRVDTLEAVPEAVKKLATKLTAHEQSVINKRLESGELSAVKNGVLGGKPLSAEQMTEYAKSRNKGAQGAFAGKFSSENKE